MTRTYFGITDVDRENVGLLSKVMAGTVGGCGLGDLTRGKPRRYPGSGRHPTPKGCQWARSCDDCPWDDCVVVNESELFSYDSGKAIQIRMDFMRKARVKDMSIKNLAVALKVSPSSVKRWSVASSHYKEIIQAHDEGTSVADIAARFGVHVRTIYRALAGRTGKS